MHGGQAREHASTERLRRPPEVTQLAGSKQDPCDAKAQLGTFRTWRLFKGIASPSLLLQRFRGGWCAMKEGPAEKVALEPSPTVRIRIWGNEKKWKRG